MLLWPKEQTKTQLGSVLPKHQSAKVVPGMEAESSPEDRVARDTAGAPDVRDDAAMVRSEGVQKDKELVEMSVRERCPGHPHRACFNIRLDTGAEDRRVLQLSLADAIDEQERLCMFISKHHLIYDVS